MLYCLILIINSINYYYFTKKQLIAVIAYYDRNTKSS